MKRSRNRLAGIGAAALASLAAFAPIGAAPAAAAPDWAATSSVTRDGAHVLGNPQADTRLITFVSYTCPHCARFEGESDMPLRAAYVQPGTLALEVRHIIRDPIDMTAVLLAECGPASRFWGNHRAIFAAQDDWMATARATTPEQRQRWSTGTLANRFKAISADLRFYELMQQRGYSRTQVDQCLSDPARVDKFANQSQADGQTYKVQGTPSFVLNGKLLDQVHTWAGLKQALDTRMN
ncbi:DsbA family protein [Altericroceibacterium xinjiangense]|uniref:DsbA family protein n=1 Tax=Altericroceibacterium xinjiangense TaxID=762261 RepID=UPI000F7E1B01|nr:thioredoxin domain-containing protein [Altericroceibacterium xinjiangense]